MQVQQPKAAGEQGGKERAQEHGRGHFLAVLSAVVASASGGAMLSLGHSRFFFFFVAVHA